MESHAVNNDRLTLHALSNAPQSLQALAFLHENGIAHGDFQPGNMLFALDDIDSNPEGVLRQEENVQATSISPPVQRLDGKQDKRAPRYLCVAAYSFRDPPAKTVAPLGLRAPELSSTAVIDNTVDVWSFGCLILELITGEALFCEVRV